MKSLTVLLLSIMLTLTVAGAEAAFYVPADPGLKGIGGAQRQAILSDLRNLAAVARLFQTQEPDTAASMQEGVNYISSLAKYTDVPSKFDDEDMYAFLVVAGEWWVGVSILDNTARSSIASASDGLYGSSDIRTPPQSNPFQDADSAAWLKAN